MKTIRNGCSLIGLIGLLIVMVDHYFASLPPFIMKATSLVLSICLAFVLFCGITMLSERSKKRKNV